MAQGDLYKILEKAYALVSENTESLREQMQMYPHEFEISAKQIEKEINIQLENIRLRGSGRTKTGTVAQQPVRTLFGIGTGASREEAEAALENLAVGPSQTEARKTRIAQLAQEFAEDIYDAAFSFAAKEGYEVSLVRGNKHEYVIRINPIKNPTPKSNPYLFIRNVLQAPAKRKLMRQLSTLLRINFDKSETFFHVGHLVAVSEEQTAAAIQLIQKGITNVETTRQVSNVAKSFINFEILSKFTALGNPEFTKQFEMGVAYVRPQSEVGNVTISDYEKAVNNEVKKAIKKIIESNPNWANQASSDSIMTALEKSLAKTVQQSGGTTTVNTKIDTTPSSAKLSTSQDVPTYRIKTKLGPIDIPGESQASAVSLRSLIPQLNERLPEFVRRNMGVMGRLHNRTGRFAESTHIVDIGDNAVITYSYMKAPYSVFESQGTRDPRPLIEGSIRELASGIISAKFGLRRV